MAFAFDHEKFRKFKVKLDNTFPKRNFNTKYLSPNFKAYLDYY